MELIILGLIGAASVFGTTALVKQQKKAKEEHYQIEKIQILDFIQNILNDRVIFRKINSTVGFLSTHFQASDQGFFLDVMITKDEIQFYLYSTNKGNTMYYHYVFNRHIKAGQVMKSERDFALLNETLLRQLEDKIVRYNWENPFSFYAKKTFEFFGDKKPKQTAPTTEEKTTPVFHEVQQDVEALEELYVEIKQVSEPLFDIEEKHQLERLFHQDFHRLKESFLLIQDKTPSDIERMKESLSIIENQLRSFYIKADMHHKQSFERAVEIIKQRNDSH